MSCPIHDPRLIQVPGLVRTGGRASKHWCPLGISVAAYLASGSCLSRIRLPACRTTCLSHYMPVSLPACLAIWLSCYLATFGSRRMSSNKSEEVWHKSEEVSGAMRHVVKQVGRAVWCHEACRETSRKSCVVPWGMSCDNSPAFEWKSVWIHTRLTEARPSLLPRLDWLSIPWHARGGIDVGILTDFHARTIWHMNVSDIASGPTRYLDDTHWQGITVWSYCKLSQCGLIGLIGLIASWRPSVTLDCFLTSWNTLVLFHDIK